jgi:hypothetical protein
MGILQRWSRYREGKQSRRQKAADLAGLIERMVQDSDPSIRKVAGYGQRLRKPVENALGHIEGLISSIPGPVGLSAESWDKDPLVHALFVSPGEIRSLLQTCAELTSFFRQSGVKTAVALLTATKKERTMFGTAQEGEIVRRDVPQVAVEFYDHRVGSPAATEAENRRGLIHRGLNLLATYALEEILRIHSIREELAAERRMLAVKLKIQHTRRRGLEQLLAAGGEKDADPGRGRQLLEEIDRQLMELEPGAATPQDFLRQLEKVLLGPENVLTGKSIAMRLNWMGVKLNETSTVNGREIALAELEIPGRVKRVALLAAVSAEECSGMEKDLA